MISAPPRLVCLPSSVTAFTDAVHTVAAQNPWVQQPADLEEALRPYFPAVRIQPRELEGEPIPTWYVYRDGRYGSKVDDEGAGSTSG